MRRTREWWFIAAALTGLVVLQPRPAAGDDAEAVKKELAALQGRWEFRMGGAQGQGFKDAIALLHGGRTDGGKGFELYALEVKENLFTFAGTPAGQVAVKIDPTRSPKTIDLIDAKGRTWLGVYELRGDTLEIFFSFDKTRPMPGRDEAIGRFYQEGSNGYAVYQRARK